MAATKKKATKGGKSATKTARASSRKRASDAKRASSRQASTRGSAKRSRKTASGSGKDGTVTVDRRRTKDRRSGADRRRKDQPVAVERRSVERRAKVSRRRQIDPTTCERDYTPDEIEFMNALDEYKRISGRMFPTCSEILEVLIKLGYEKRPKQEADAQSADPPAGRAPSPASSSSGCPPQTAEAPGA